MRSALFAVPIAALASGAFLISAANRPTPMPTPPMPIQVSTVTATNTDGYVATASCPSGQVVVGGGGNAWENNLPTPRGYVPLGASHPVNAMTWEVIAVQPWHHGVHQVDATVLCAPGTAVP